MFGFCGTMAALTAGASIHTVPVFDVDRTVRILRDARIHQTNGTDEMVRRLLEGSHEATPFPDLRFAGFAAFNYPPADMIAMGDKRGVALVGLYGMSEIQALFARQSETAPPGLARSAGGAVSDCRANSAWISLMP